MNALNFAPIYIAYRSAHSVIFFFKHWYIDSFFAIDRFMRGLLGRLDRTVALKITARNIFQPLYQDYSYLGHILGFLFRSIRLTGGGILYGILIAISMACYAFWISIPLFIFYKLIW